MALFSSSSLSHHSRRVLDVLNLEGRELGGCRLIRKIGEGGMGEVYLAEQIKVGNRQVAVKVMRPDPGAYSMDVAEDAKRRFEREAATLGALEHPNILPIYDAGVEDDYFYIVMQYAPDGSLADCIRGRSRRTLTLPLDAGITVDIVTQVASALQFIHSKKLVHRDVKPANVLTQESPDAHWRMLLADFGVARGLDNTSQRTQVTGTMTYMAPEQFSGKFSPATDQYALAVMTYQFLAGRPPFEGELGAVMRGHTSEPPPPLRAINPSVPVGVEAAVMRGLAKEPEQRFPTVSAYAQALQSGLRANPTPPPLPTEIAPPVVVLASSAAPGAPRWPVGDGGKSPDQRGRAGLGRAWLVGLAAVLLLIGIVGASVYANRQNQARVSAQATQTAQARGTQSAGGTPTTGVTVTATTSGTTPGATVSPVPTLSPPSSVGALVFDSAAPLCDTGDSVTWIKGNGVTVSCPGGSQTSLTSATASTLACVAAQNISQANGYVTAQVSSQSGHVELGFRQGIGNPTSSGNNITGYYVAVDAQSSIYVLYKVDDAGATHTIKQESLAAPLPPTFQMAALFTGSTITVFVNGQAFASVQDSDFANGWVAACTDGAATFSHVKLYAAS
jgi:eukaryotic-like serine/threonine-protein kinase